MYAVDLRSDEVRELTASDGVQARLINVSHKLPEEIIVGLNDRDPQWHDIYRVNLVTGERTLILRNDRFLDVVLDD